MKTASFVSVMSLVVFGFVTVAVFIAITIIFGRVPPWLLLTIVAGAEIWGAIFSMLQMAELKPAGCLVMFLFLVVSLVLGLVIMTILGIGGQYLQFAFLAAVPMATGFFVQVKPFVDAQRIPQKGGGSDYS